MDANQTSQSQQPNPTPTPVNPSHNSKLIQVIFGVAAVIAIAIGAYLLGTKQSQPVVQNKISPTPLPAKASATEGDPTANWKTYTNGLLGIVFKYPNDWSLKEDFLSGIAGDSSGKKINIYSKTPVRINLEPLINPKGNRIDIAVFDNNENLSIIDLENESTDPKVHPAGMSSDLYSPKDSQVNFPSNIVAYHNNTCRYDGPGYKHCERYSFAWNKKVYRVWNGVNDTYSTIQNAILSQILSTFKFSN